MGFQRDYLQANPVRGVKFPQKGVVLRADTIIILKPLSGRYQQRSNKRMPGKKRFALAPSCCIIAAMSEAVVTQRLIGRRRFLTGVPRQNRIRAKSLTSA